MTQEEETNLAVKHGFDCIRDDYRGDKHSKWSRFKKGNINVWTGFKFPWIRAILEGNLYVEHQGFKELEDALLNVNGEPLNLRSYV